MRSVKLTSIALILACALVGCQVSGGVFGQASSSGQSCAAARPDDSLNVGGAERACGFQIGSAIASLDCSTMNQLPKGFVAQHSKLVGESAWYAKVDFTGAGCQVDGAAGDEMLTLGLSVSAADVLEVVDFSPNGGPVQGYELELRCGGGGCITFTIGGPGFGDRVYERRALLLLGYTRPSSIAIPWPSFSLRTLMHAGQFNRAIFAVHGGRITVCLNGRCWSSGQSAVTVTTPGDATFSLLDAARRNAASVLIARFMVFHVA
jgi:hypothetical protein